MKKIKTKVAIVGSGGAGLRCAIHLWESGEEDILIVGDRKFNDAHTVWARGGINAALGTMDPDDTPLTHAVDTYVEAQYVANPHLVEMLTDNAPDGINDLLRRGANFHTEDSGELTQRFFGAHTYRRTCFSGDETGLEMIRTMCRRSHELDIPYLEFIYIYKLLVQDGKVQGLLGIKDGEIYHIEAPVVVFATGGFPNVYWRSSSRNKENFGDGIGMAFREGAKIGDIELVQFHPTGLMYPEEHTGELVTEAVRGEGGKLFNAKGERFMEKYDPEKMELSTRDVVARANFWEIMHGNGTPNGGVRLDISERSKEYLEQRLPKMLSMIQEYNNVDISQAPVEVAPTAHYTMGGIWFDHETLETTIENFFVAGECTMGLHGGNRLGGNSLMETMVFGKKVAEKILTLTPSSATMEVDSDMLDRYHLDSNGVDAISMLENIRKSCWKLAGILREESELLELQTHLANCRREIEQQGIKPVADKTETIINAMRVLTVIDLAELLCKGALERKECRGAHYRTDHTAIDPQFQKNFFHQKVDGSVISTWEHTPQPSERLQKALDAFDDDNRLKNYTHQE